MVPKNEDDELPPEVQAEVDKALREPEAEQHAESEASEVPAPKLSRRQEAEQERRAQIDAATRRAEAAEKLAGEIRDEFRKTREADMERSARMEAALQVALQRPHHEPQQRRDEGPSIDEKMKKLRKERDEALSAGNVAVYHEAVEELAELRAASKYQGDINNLQGAIQQIRQQPQQQFQKPPWVTAVESQYGDVMIHPSGTNTVAAFVQMGGGQVNPEALDKAFKRAREELGLSKRAVEKNQQQRQVLAGGSSNAIPKNGSSKGGGSVKMPAGWQDAARKAGMSADDYKRAHIAMHPEDVVRE